MAVAAAEAEAETALHVVGLGGAGKVGEAIQHEMA